jgi:hypothetical protein
MHCTDMTWTNLVRNEVQRQGFLSRWWILPFHDREILDQLSEYVLLTQVPVSFGWSDIVRGEQN